MLLSQIPGNARHLNRVEASSATAWHLVRVRETVLNLTNIRGIHKTPSVRRTVLHFS